MPVYNSEEIIKNTARAAEQLLILPLNLRLTHEPFSNDFVQALATHRLAEQGQDFVRFNDALTRLILPSGAYPEAITNGAYDRIGRLAAAKGIEAAQLAANYRGQETLTIPDAFAVHGLISFMANLNRPHVDSVAHSPDRTTFFLTRFGAALARQVTDEELYAAPNPYDIAEGLQDISKRLGIAIGESEEWVSQKYHMLAEYLSIRKHTIRIIDFEPSMEVDDLDELARNNDALFKELTRLRRYSIKSAIHQDGEVAWSIHDSMDFEVQQAAIAADSQIKISNWPPVLRMIALEQLADTEQMYIADAIADQRKTDREGFGRIVFMDDSGNLFADHHGAFAYKDLYAHASKPQNYEVLRQKMLRYYFDLTVPTDVVRQVIDDERRMLGSDSIHHTKYTPNQVVYADFLLPRIRRLKNFKTIGQMERFETDLPKEQETATKKKLELPLHPVVAHPRTLPPGYKPSREALELAEKLGIELEPGQTVVGKHNRGDAKYGVIVHKAKKKP